MFEPRQNSEPKRAKTLPNINPKSPPDLTHRVLEDKKTLEAYPNPPPDLNHRNHHVLEDEKNWNSNPPDLNHHVHEDEKVWKDQMKNHIGHQGYDGKEHFFDEKKFGMFGHEMGIEEFTTNFTGIFADRLSFR